MLHLWVGPIKLSTCDPPCFFSFLWFDIHRPRSPGIQVLNGGATRWKESGSPSHHLDESASQLKDTSFGIYVSEK